MRSNIGRRLLFLILGMVLCLSPARLAAALSSPPDESQEMIYLKQQFEALNHRLDELEKAVDDVLWFERVGDIAFVDKVRIVGPPRWKETQPTAQGAGNPIKFYTYVFIPKGADRTKKHPLLVLPHGGSHANFDTYHTHIIREMVSQGYVVVAADYRGSTGYGPGLYRLVDYGGLENEDVWASRNFVVDNYDFVDKNRVGIIGWSHGGLIALMNVFDHPEGYQVCFAGNPVSDLVARMGYKDQSYRDEFEADFSIGQSANDNIAEYRRRSPVTHVDKLRTPLLIHANTNDEDVNVLEVEYLIQALKAAGKEFKYEIFKDAPGGHSMDRLDILNAKKIRLKIYDFLARYLKPAHPFKSVEDLQKAGYY